MLAYGPHRLNWLRRPVVGAGMLQGEGRRKVKGPRELQFAEAQFVDVGQKLSEAQCLAQELLPLFLLSSLLRGLLLSCHRVIPSLCNLLPRRLIFLTKMPYQPKVLHEQYV
jgi:hypothetical protein